MISTLKERMSDYEHTSNMKLTKKLPVIICLNGRSFKKTTSPLHKPYSNEFMEAMCSVMIRLASEIDGSTFLYTFNDEIIIVLRNDQHIETEAWYDNDIQKICSATASLASIALQNALKISNINILGDPIFTSKTFVLPNMSEVINFLIYKQQQCLQSAISCACFYELLKKYDPAKVIKNLQGRSFEEKIEILQEERGMSIYSYPLSFHRGAACYRILKEHESGMKSKLHINMELPVFSKEFSLLKNILRGL